MSTPNAADTAIDVRAGAAIAGCVHPAGRAEGAARAWTDTLHTRAHIRAERHLRHARQ